MNLKSRSTAGTGTLHGTVRMARCLAIVLLVLTALVTRVTPTYAATLTVGTCDEPTLRATIGQAGSGDTIDFSCGGTINLTSVIPINTTLTIDGKSVISLTGIATPSQIFKVPTSGNLTLKNIILKNGNAGATGSGGAIQSDGTLTVDHSGFYNNQAGANGGAIASTGSLTVTNSTFSGNSAAGHGGAVDANNSLGRPASILTGDTFTGNSALDGGAASFGSNNPVSIVNSTFTGNSASRDGGALYTYALLTVDFSTIANNVGSVPAIGFNGGGLQIGGSILDNALNCGATPPSASPDNGSNLTFNGVGPVAGTDNCGMTHSTLLGVDPQLGSLADNGGPTQTMALAPTSPAVDGATSCTVGNATVATDQRGTVRPQGSACDIGAYEFVPADITAPASVITFPTASVPYNSAGWAGGCTPAPGICGTASDPAAPGVPASGVAKVEVSIQATNGPSAGYYWTPGSSSVDISSPPGFFGANPVWLPVNGTATWNLPFALPADGTTFVVQSRATDAAGNVEPLSCSTCGATTAPNTSTATADTTQPLVSSVLVDTQTQSGAVNISPNSTVHITFSEPLSQATVNASTISVASGTPAAPGTAVTATPLCTDGGLCQNVELRDPTTPANPLVLAPSTTYTITMHTAASGCTSSTCLEDRASNPLSVPAGTPSAASNAIFTLTTAASPHLPSCASQGPPCDTDQDGIPDGWDGASFTANGQTIDTHAWGFSSSQKDLCLVEDYMNGAAANGTAYNQFIAKAANQAIVNAFAAHGIHMVIFESAGPAGTPATSVATTSGSAGLPTGYTGPDYGGQIPMTDPLGSTNPDGHYDYRAFDSLKRSYFLQSGLEQVCHLAIIGHSQGGSTSSGSSRGFHASDFLVTLGGATAGIGNQYEQQGTVMHELGHNLGLHHGGGDDLNYKPNYLSVMNYFFQFQGLIVNGAAGTLDYSGTQLPTLTEGSLLEPTGLTSAVGSYGTKHYCGTAVSVVSISSSNVNWNCDTSRTGALIETSPVSYDLNGDGNATETLNGYNDWAAVQLAGDGTIGDGAQPPLPADSVIDQAGGATDPQSGGVDSIPNVEVPQQLPVALDLTAPTITITSPIGPYFLHQSLLSAYTCNDNGGSGVVACYDSAGGVSTAPPSVDTSTVGSKIFTVTSQDSNQNGSQSSVTYSVNYKWNGFFAPLSADSLGKVINTGKAGRTYPVKFQLMDANGVYTSDLTAVKSITYSPSTACTSAGTTDPVDYATTSNSGLRYDSSANQYMYNWATPGSAGCYMLHVRLLDGTTRNALFRLS